MAGSYKYSAYVYRYRQLTGKSLEIARQTRQENVNKQHQQLVLMRSIAYTMTLAIITVNAHSKLCLGSKLFKPFCDYNFCTFSTRKINLKWLNNDGVTKVSKQSRVA